MLRTLFLGIFFFSSHTIVGQSAIPIEGQHYRTLSESSNESNQVVLYCWLGSPSCYQVEHALTQWVLNLDLVLINEPLIKRPEWRRLAKGRLVARLLDKEAEFSLAIYEAIHLDKKVISDDDVLIDLAEQAGLSRTRFTNLFYAAETNQALNDIQTEAATVPVNGVPTIILKQRWLLDASMHRTSRSLLNTLNYLLSQDD